MGLRICLSMILILRLELFCALFILVGEEDVDRSVMNSKLRVPKRLRFDQLELLTTHVQSRALQHKAERHCFVSFLGNLSKTRELACEGGIKSLEAITHVSKGCAIWVFIREYKEAGC